MSAESDSTEHWSVMAAPMARIPGAVAPLRDTCLVESGGSVREAEVVMSQFGDDECAECRHLWLEGTDPCEYTLTPADGGGWSAWSAALLRLVQRLAKQPTQAMIITQDVLTRRYVQVLIGHGIAHAEASSNIYLSGDSRLLPDHEELLELVGWLPPASDHDDPDDMPANWSWPLVQDDWSSLTEVICATIIGIFGFSEHLPITIRTFQCDAPCKACSWPDQSVDHA